MRGWLYGLLDETMLPMLKLITPGYRRRLAPFRPAGTCDLEALGAVSAPHVVQRSPDRPWRGYQVESFRFASPTDCLCPECEAVTGRLLLGTPDAPWAVVVPGYATGAFPPHSYSLFQEKQGLALLQQGINVALIDLPLHMKRRQPGRSSGERFFSPDLAWTQAAFRQAAADVIALVRWLETVSGRRVALWGTSLGGCIAGLAAVRLPDLAAVALMEPLDNPGDVMARLRGTWEIRAELRRAGLEPEHLPAALRGVAPSSYEPAVARERLLFVTPLWDRVVHTPLQEAFWQAWGAPKRLSVNAGHITAANDFRLNSRVAGFLAGWLFDRNR
jgi:pimeloyl-ACP methyl ester carboxylesterase